MITIADREYDTFWGEIIKDPDEWSRYLVFADWLDERRVPMLAHTFRWMGHRHQRPHFRDFYRDRAGNKVRAVPVTHSWAWYPAWYQSWPGSPVPEYARLPRVVFAAINATDHCYSDSIGQAVHRLVIALELLRDSYQAVSA